MTASTIDCRPYAESLKDLVSSLPEFPRMEIHLFLEAAKRASEKLSPALREVLDEFNANSNWDGYLLLRGMPIEPDEDLPPTPRFGPPPTGRQLLNMEGILAIIGSQLGLMSAYDQGYGNRRASTVLHELYPTPWANPLSAETTEIPLEFHSDLSHHARQPNYIVLACMRADHEHQAATLIASASKATALLSPEAKDGLFDKAFTRPIDNDTKIAGDSAKVKVLYGDRNDPYMCYDRSFLASDDPDDREAISALARAIDEVAEPVRLAPGDVLVMDNIRATHARTPFTARWDGKDRWLSRAYVRTDRNGQLSGGERAGDIVPFVPRR
jgi:alpha-ketoglutarate-dependent taurine dioxygenase